MVQGHRSTWSITGPQMGQAGPPPTGCVDQNGPRRNAPSCTCWFPSSSTPPSWFTPWRPPLSWCAVGFFTAVSVAANAAHVLAPGGVPVPLNGTVIFGSFLAAIMPISLFFPTETRLHLAVAPPVGSVSQRRKWALARLVGTPGPENPDQFGAISGPPAGQRGPSAGPVRGPLLDHPSEPPRTKADVNPGHILELAGQNLLAEIHCPEVGNVKVHRCPGPRRVCRVPRWILKRWRRCPRPSDV